MSDWPWDWDSRAIALIAEAAACLDNGEMVWDLIEGQFRFEEKYPEW